jgi:hypothetical protein
MGKAAPQLEPYQFKPGSPPGPGRPKGSRAKLQELAVALLHEDFAVHGKDVIERVRQKKPEVYLASVVSLLPKQAQKLESPFLELTDDELEQLESYLTAIRAQTVQQIEATPEPDHNGHKSTSITSIIEPDTANTAQETVERNTETSEGDRVELNVSLQRILDEMDGETVDDHNQE